jgi:hypothetical protein
MAADPVADEQALRGHAEALGDAVVAAVPGWVRRCVHEVADGWRPGLGARLAGEADRAAEAAVADLAPRLRHLLATDVDRQATGPLDLCRSVVVHPTRVLAEAGVPPRPRDEFSVRQFPDDVYDLSPASFTAIDPALTEVGLVWGAAKAHVVLARRRAEGVRPGPSPDLRER